MDKEDKFCRNCGKQLQPVSKPRITSLEERPASLVELTLGQLIGELMNVRPMFVILGIFYLSVLVISYLLAVSYTSLAPYGFTSVAPYSLLLIPIIANFCVGYLAKDVYTAVKIIVAGFFLQAGIIFALLYSSSASDVFVGVTVYSSYYVLQVPLSLAAALAGTFVREDINDIVAVGKHSIELLLERGAKVKFAIVVSILLLMGMSSTWISSYSYRVEGEILRVLPDGRTINMVYCGFPLPYLTVTNHSMISFGALDIKIWPYNPINFMLDTLLYTSIYSIVTVFGYAIIRSMKTKETIRRIFGYWISKIPFIGKYFTRRKPEDQFA